MRLEDHYGGGEDPFEGDRTLWLRSLPAGARVTKATVTFTPAAPAGGTRFTESIAFDQNGVGNWGAMRSPASLGAATSQAVAELHARRTVVEVQAGGEVANRPATVQVNLGGTWVGLADDGTILTSGKQPLILTLPITPPTGMPASTSLPQVTADKIQLTAVNSDRMVDPSGRVSLYGLTVSSVPSNVSMRLGEKPPFWMHLGELAAAQTSPDFAPVLNAFLAAAQIKVGFYAIPFVVHSDAIARLDVDLAVEYVLEQPILPSFLPEVTLPYGYSSLPGLAEDLLTARLPRAARPISASSRAVQGTFDASRVVYGQIGEAGSTTKAAVTSDRALAQPILLDAETAASAIDLPLANTQAGLADLNLALQSDADGTPSGEVLINAKVTVERPLPGGSSWGSAELPSEFRFHAGRRYWLVLQILSGQDQAFWEASKGSAQTLLASSDGGFSWRTAVTEKGEQPLQAIFRLRHVPEHFTVPVQLQIGRGADAKRVRFDRFAPLGRVEFDMDFTAQLSEYLASPAAAPSCGKGELLLNGGFEQPPHTDATMKLFGLPAPQSASGALTGTVNLDAGVDLSVQRYIVLSIAGAPAVRIDCAGAVPERTRVDEILEAINLSMGNNVASYDDGLIITAPATGGEVALNPWCCRQVPEGWTGIASHILRINLRGSLFIVLVSPHNLLDSSMRICPDGIRLADPGEPAELVQKVPVSAGCSYILSLLMRSLGGSEPGKDSGSSISILSRDVLFPPFAQPGWEVLWLDGSGQVIKTDGGTLDFFVSLGQFHLTAPSAAALAEVRFIQPSPGALLLQRVSLIPSREKVRNARLSWTKVQSAGGIVPSLWGWSVASGKVTTGPDGTILHGEANVRSLPDDTAISQSVQVKENESYELRVKARSMKPADNGAGLPQQQPSPGRLELRWMADQAVIGVPVTISLDGRDFSAHAWAGAAPAGANQAEIRLIQPRGGGDMLVESVSLRHSDLVSVPLVFLAEAPGDLTVSGLQVAYDLPEETLPLALPRPSRQSVSRGRMQASARVPERATVQPAPAAPARSPLVDLDIRAVNGISDHTADILAGMAPPISTISQLAALDPENEITGLSHERRLIVKAAAETILSLDFQAEPFLTLSNQTLDALLALKPEKVAEQAGRPVGSAARLQRHLRSLKLLLKSDAFRRLRLPDLITG